MEALYISGHQNPDTDSIVAAISYASLKRETGEPDALAVRLGPIVSETAFVLGRFGFSPPPLLASARTQLRDIEFDLPKTVSPGVTIRKAWETMLTNRLRTLPITDASGRLCGICTSSDITDYEMRSSDREYMIRTHAQNLCDTLSGWLLCGEARAVEGCVRIATSDRDFKNSSGILLAEWREGIETLASHSSASAVILCHGSNVAGVEGNLPVVATPYDLYTVSRLITQAVPVSAIMRREGLVTFLLDDYVDDVLKLLLSTRHRSYPVLNADGRVVGAVSRVHMINHRKKRLVLVDHNEKSQSVPGIDQAEVIEIIDHHRLGDVQTVAPIFFRNEPVGSTTTIIAGMYAESRVMPTPEMAGLMLAGILSDTVLFKSPTATAKDRSIADWLAGIAKQDAGELGRELFNAITHALRSKSPEELLFYDFKEYSLGGKKIGIGQVTCWDAEGIPTDEIQRAMDRLLVDERFDIVLFMQTEIVKNGTTLLLSGDDRELVANALGVRDAASSFFLSGVMSRKKQLVPSLSILGSGPAPV